MEASKKRWKEHLLVCGPTNKSVTVLLRKVLDYCRHEESIKLVLIGDKSELLGDDTDVELESRYALSYTKLRAREFRDLGKELLDHNDIDHFDFRAHEVMQKIKTDIPSVKDLHIVEHALDSVRSAFLDQDDNNSSESSDTIQASKEEKAKKMQQRRPKKERERKIKEAVNTIAVAVNKLDQQEVVQELLRQAQVVFCTLSSSGSMPIIRMDHVSDIIIDEASACTEPEILVPLRKKPKRMLLVGDPKQLPPMVQSPEAIKKGLSRSLQDRFMFRNNFPFTLLDVQYRMKPEISSWPVKQFYDGKVQDGSNVTSQSYSTDQTTFQGDPYIWVNVSGPEEKNASGSTLNIVEADTVISMLLNMKNELGIESFHPDRLRIITFYKAQVDFLKMKLARYNIEALVSTVDGSQGCEADVVILSFVRGTSGFMGFLKDNRRLNVALTRARFQLICVGNLDAIAGIETTGGNFELQDMASDAFQRSRIVTPPPSLPPPPPRYTGKFAVADGIATGKSKKKKKKKKKEKSHTTKQ